jgi:hypothetical protein
MDLDFFLLVDFDDIVVGKSDDVGSGGGGGRGGDRERVTVVDGDSSVVDADTCTGGGGGSSGAFLLFNRLNVDLVPQQQLEQDIFFCLFINFQYCRGV